MLGSANQVESWAIGCSPFLVCARWIRHRFGIRRSILHAQKTSPAIPYPTARSIRTGKPKEVKNRKTGRSNPLNPSTDTRYFAMRVGMAFSLCLPFVPIGRFPGPCELPC